MRERIHGNCDQEKLTLTLKQSQHDLIPLTWMKMVNTILSILIHLSFQLITLNLNDCVACMGTCMVDPCVSRCIREIKEMCSLRRE